jgi:outer membrane cobalamin receptor
MENFRKNRTVLFPLQAGTIPFLTLIILLASSLHGQEAADGEEPQPLDPIEVSVEAHRQTAADLPAQVSVITAEEIAASEARSVAEILSSVSGVGLEKYGNITQPGLISIRGSSAEQVLVLVDGVRINTAQGGGVDLNTLPLDSIERIEIIRGGGSALFGEGAMGGIVNIVTRKSAARKTAGSVSYSYGSFNTHRADARIEGPLGKTRASYPDRGEISGEETGVPFRKDSETREGSAETLSWHYSLSGGGYWTEGTYSYPDDYESGGTGERLNADGYSLEGTAKIEGASRGNGSLLTLLCQGGFRETGVPGLLEFPSRTARMADASLAGSLTASSIPTALGHVAGTASLQYRTRTYTDPDWYLGAVDDTHANTAARFSASLEREDRWGILSLRSAAGLSFDIDHLNSTALVTGSGLTDSGIVSRFTEGAHANIELGLFPQEAGPSRITLTPALRYEASQTRQGGTGQGADRGDWSWGAGTIVSLDSAGNWNMKANAGSSYRMPSFNDLFWPATSFASGNPCLLPETSLFWDAGIAVHPVPFLKLQAAWFSQSVENLIQWNPGPSGQWTPSNIGMADIRGLECEAAVMVPLAGGILYGEINGNYTYLRATDVTEGAATYGKQLTRRPFERANCALTLSHMDGHSVRISGQYVGFRYTTAMNTKTIPAYFLLNAAFTVVIGDWEIALSGMNLLDTPYINLEEYPVPGREIQIEGRLKL